MARQHDSDETPTLNQDAQPTHEHSHGLVDRAFFYSERGMWATKVSLVALFIIACFQMIVVLLAGSVALLADTIHTLSDLVATVPLWVAFALAKRKANRSFNYGYGRAEDLAGLAIVFSMVVSAGFVGWQSILRFVDPPDVQFLWVVMVAGTIGFVGNEGVAQFRIRVGKDIGSASLVADGHHARIDGLTSLLVLGGAIAVRLGEPRADPIMGMLITVIILRITWSSFKLVLSRLLDRVDPEILDQVREVAADVSGVQDVNEVRVRWMGHRLVLDISIAVARALPVGRGHVVAQEVQRRVVDRLAYVCTVNVHLSPYGVLDETYYDAEQFQQLPEATPSHTSSDTLQQQPTSYDQALPIGAGPSEDENTVGSVFEAEAKSQQLNNWRGNSFEIGWGSAFKVAFAVVVVLLLTFIVSFVVAITTGLI